MKVIDKQLEKLGQCTNDRVKRDIADAAMDVVEDFVGYGVTNFVKSVFAPAGITMEVTKSLVRSAIDNIADYTRSLLNSREERQSMDMRKIYAVSETARQHPAEVAEAIDNVPIISWSGVHLESEMLAGLANIRTIEKYCTKRNRLAAKELAEISGYDKLAELEPDDVRLLDISVNMNDRTFTVTYQHKSKFYPWLLFYSTIVLILAVNLVIAFYLARYV